MHDDNMNKPDRQGMKWSLLFFLLFLADIINFLFWFVRQSKEVM